MSFRTYLNIGLWVAAVAVVVPVFLINPATGVVAAFAAVAVIAVRSAFWLAVCSAAWSLVFLAVLTIPGPYDSPAGRGVIPVLGLFVACFLAAWYAGRRLAGDGRPDPAAEPEPGPPLWWIRPTDQSVRPGSSAAGRTRSTRPTLRWPSDNRLTAFLLVVLLIAIIGGALKFGTTLPPLFAENPDVARASLGEKSNIYVGLLAEAWTLGMAISLLRALNGKAEARWRYLLLVVVFTFGAALGASKNSVLVGIVPALVAALSTRRETAMSSRNRRIAALVVILIGLGAVGGAVYLGGQRTLAGTGTFEDQFRAQYGGNPIYTSVGSLDLSLSSSVETFGRLWEHRAEHELAWGRYSLTFTGSVGDRFLGPVDLYKVTGGLSQPFYMNTATFAAVPLMDYGPVGAAIFLALTGLCVGFVERRLGQTRSPAHHLGRAFLIYYATFGVYEFYPVIQPFWLSLVPGLVAFYLVSNPSRLVMPTWKP
ncbi:O-antigen polymerase [Micromonospora inositola]|uniref:Oligosaccharide repeat unit polymerase n=1 Tax=Micromonospora inositola TaxID=47865 RepID=A0A1C5GYG9_9ACTN|nr:O-antigen polymerase [Micromonospora inositola]SCG38790.1 oligosaccharide repeat unit polymerase [Micromonospora inositola]